MTDALEQDAAKRTAGALATETGCQVRPCETPGRFEAAFPDCLLIGTMREIREWHRATRVPPQAPRLSRAGAGCRGRDTTLPPPAAPGRPADGGEVQDPDVRL